MTTTEFLSLITTLRNRYPFSVTSWLRTPKRNKEVGGVANSRHLLGLAVDTVLDAEGDKPAFIADVGRLGLKALDEGDHIHVQGG